MIGMIMLRHGRGRVSHSESRNRLLVTGPNTFQVLENRSMMNAHIPHCLVDVPCIDAHPVIGVFPSASRQGGCPSVLFVSCDINYDKTFAMLDPFFFSYSKKNLELRPAFCVYCLVTARPKRELHFHSIDCVWHYQCLKNVDITELISKNLLVTRLSGLPPRISVSRCVEAYSTNTIECRRILHHQGTIAPRGFALHTPRAPAVV